MSRLFGKLLPSPKQNDDNQSKLFTRSEYFQYFRQQNLSVTSPELGASGAPLSRHHGGDGDSAFPSLAWTWTEDTNSDRVASVKEYLLVVEDVDTPFSGPDPHGIFYRIPAAKCSVEAADFQRARKGTFDRDMVGGFKYAPLGKTTGTFYKAPKPILGHGPHRYHYQVIALRTSMDRGDLSQFPTRCGFYGMLEGKIVGWGEWVGVYERK